MKKLNKQIFKLVNNKIHSSETLFDKRDCLCSIGTKRFDSVKSTMGIAHFKLTCLEKSFHGYSIPAV